MEVTTSTDKNIMTYLLSTFLIFKIHILYIDIFHIHSLIYSQPNILVLTGNLMHFM
jgi:hypothetical protein